MSAELTATGLVQHLLCFSSQDSGASPAGFAVGPWVLERTGPFLFAPQVDTASEVEELEADNVSLLPAVAEGDRGGARVQVFLARYRWVLTPAPRPSGIWGA